VVPYPTSSNRQQWPNHQFHKNQAKTSPLQTWTYWLAWT
jgi:hypothetical protein